MKTLILVLWLLISFNLNAQNVTTYHENGKIHEQRTYKNKEMHGVWLTFNDKGIKVSEANYIDGKKDGKWYIWNDKGQLIYELYYTNGKKSGIWIEYHLGEVKNKRNYDIN